MKNKLWILLISCLLITGYSDMNILSVKAEETVNQDTGEQVVPTVTPTPIPSTPTPIPSTPTPTPVTVAAGSITILQYPSKLVYESGEDLDLSDMIVQANYIDGTTGIITDYTVLGYDAGQVGTHTIVINYQNHVAAFGITVVPAKISNIAVSNPDKTSVTLTWDADISAVRYEIYTIDQLTGLAVYYTSTYNNMITFYHGPGTIQAYQICAVENVLGVEYKSELSDTYYTATNPEAVLSLTVTETTVNSISLLWDEVTGATGYIIYRTPAGSDEYTAVGSSDAAFYTDENLASGTGYYYKVTAYTLDENYQGEESPIVDTSTNPARINVKYKAGEGKIRFSWNKIIGATSYDLFIADEENGDTLLQSFPGDTAVNYLVEGLLTGNTYQFYAIAHREYNEVIYDSPATDRMEITLEEIEATSREPKYLTDETRFKESQAYKKLSFFKKNVNYTKSYPIPGIITTNVGGFASTTMCPQGTAFTDDYLLISAYDLAGEENSVIYVLNKKSQDLITTLILPSKPHAGGLAFDGANVWITIGAKVANILYSDIIEAADRGEPYAYVDYYNIYSLAIKASYCTYYDGKLWVGTYNELKSTKMVSYIIEDKETEPYLTKVDRIIMPTRVQGVAFTEKGTLIISRSCQLYKGLRGYMRQLDVYQPDLSSPVDGFISLGERINSVSMPSMNEGIAISGKYLYVLFESAAFEKSSYKMDHVAAFKLTNIVKKKS